MSWVWDGVEGTWPWNKRMDGGGLMVGGWVWKFSYFPSLTLPRERQCLSCNQDVCSSRPALFLSLSRVISGQQKALLKGRGDRGIPGTFGGTLLHPFLLQTHRVGNWNLLLLCSKSVGMNPWQEKVTSRMEANGGVDRVM